MLVYRGHIYRLVTAAVTNSGELADAIADFIFTYHKNDFNADTVQQLSAEKIAQTLLSELTTLENAALYFSENYPGMEYLTGEEIENQLNAGLDADVRYKLVAQYTGPQGVSADLKNRLRTSW